MSFENGNYLDRQERERDQSIIHYEALSTRRRLDEPFEKRRVGAPEKVKEGKTISSLIYASSSPCLSLSLDATGASLTQQTCLY